MNIQWIETFVTAAHLQNFHQTAERLYRSQPTVTVHIRQLENLLGVPLFQKSGRAVTLTPYGRKYVKHAEQILASFEEGLVDMERERQGYYRQLRIAVSPQIASSYLPYWVKMYTRAYPDTEVIVSVYESADIGEAVESGKVDLGLSRQAYSSLHITSESVQKERLRFVLPHDGGDEETSLPVTVEEALERHVLITDNHPGYWDTVIWAIKQRVPAFRQMRVSQVHVTKRFIEEGLGCSVLPLSSVRRELAEGRMMEAELGELELPLVCTYIVHGQKTEEATEFLTIMKERT
ncbi:LysR family transcriptional regulator [Geomicrobium sp. JSM 1781026]|uniref:LysR family transcriptional regulator n=1 Tax=Geomicrobium sp. JSM 1781026 TaxID=3344580 RepID=UPI0035C0567A